MQCKEGAIEEFNTSLVKYYYGVYNKEINDLIVFKDVQRQTKYKLKCLLENVKWFIKRL